MKEVSIKLVWNADGDWVVVYVNDILYDEDHTVSWSNIIKEFRYFTGEIIVYEVSSEYMENGLSNNFNDLDRNELNL